MREDVFTAPRTRNRREKRTVYRKNRITIEEFYKNYFLTDRSVYYMMSHD